MGTRALIQIKHDDKVIVNITSQYDGYFEGIGKRLQSYLKNKHIVNGYQNCHTLDNSFNGMGCLAAALTAHLKTGIGNIYITPDVDLWADYIYTITCSASIINLTGKHRTGGEKQFTLYDIQDI